MPNFQEGEADNGKTYLKLNIHVMNYLLTTEKTDIKGNVGLVNAKHSVNWIVLENARPSGAKR